MSHELTGLLTVAVLAVAAVIYKLSRPSDEKTNDERGLPDELRGARLMHAEQTFHSEKFGVIARLDRAYQLDGELVLVEFKTRRVADVFMADIIELSVQRVAVQEERQVKVSRAAWVVVQSMDDGNRSAHRVTLLEATEVQALRMRYLAVQSGVAQNIRGARSGSQCLHCGHREVCTETTVSCLR